MISIRIKLTIVVVILLSLFLGLLLLGNALLLESYYISQTKAPFLSVYEELLTMPLSRPQQVSFLRKLGAETGYKIMITDNSGNILVSSAPEFRIEDKLQLPREQDDYFKENFQSIRNGKIYFGVLDENVKKQANVQLMAKLRKNQYLIITQPLRQLRRNVQIATNFFLIIGGIILIPGIIAVFILSGRMTRPIVELTAISQSIANLDFSKRYNKRPQDELGILGKSINHISEELNHTINSLQKANREIQTKMELQKRFLASVSHDFKTPVGLIRGYAETLADGIVENKEKQGEIADIIISEADRLDQLVSNILLVIKSENQTLPLNKKEYDLALLIRQTVNRFSKKINEKKISFTVDVPPLLTSLCDAQQIMRVLDNLISNSIQHIDNKRSIMINAKKKKKYIRIEVINTGKHIPKEHIDNLFDPFYRVDLSRSRESGGTGLGLAVVKSIVLAHGGIFGVENIKNSVCFWFDIPAKVASH